MKSEKFIQFFDAENKPILSTQGIVNYDRRSKTPDSIRKSIKAADLVPKEAKYFQVQQTILASIIKVTPIYEL